MVGYHKQVSRFQGSRVSLPVEGPDVGAGDEVLGLGSEDANSDDEQEGLVRDMSLVLEGVGDGEEVLVALLDLDDRDLLSAGIVFEVDLHYLLNSELVLQFSHDDIKGLLFEDCKIINYSNHVFELSSHFINHVLVMLSLLVK